MAIESKAALDAAADLDLLRLSLIPGIGPLRLTRLLESFHSAGEALAAAPAALQQAGLPIAIAESLRSAAAEVNPEGVLADCRAHGIQIVRRGTPDYPPRLAELPDAPPLLFRRGTFSPSDVRGIAVVGSRRATPYGLRMTERLVTDLVAHGYCIVSGLARGIDAMAHRTALRVGGRTIAVLGSGLLSIYPPEHAGLADEVAQHGALLSEFAPRTPPRAGQFPQRNRLLSGLVEGVLVVEAGTRSGALITVRMALEQGREVFAVPGPVDRESSRGCHSLLKDGAILVESVADIMAELEPQALAKSAAGPRHAVQPGRPSAGHGVQPIEPELDDPQQRVVYELVTSEPRLIDEVIARSGLTAPQALAAIGALELRRLIGRINGPYLQRLAPLPVEAVRRMPLPR